MSCRRKLGAVSRNSCERSQFSSEQRRARSVCSCCRPALIGFLALAILLLGSAFAQAASYYWNASSGDWSNASNWGGIEPTGSDTAYINNSGTATITQTGEICRDLCLGSFSTDTGTINMTGGSLTVSAYDLLVGQSDTGTFTQTGGTNSLTGRSILVIIPAPTAHIISAVPGSFPQTILSILAIRGRALSYKRAACIHARSLFISAGMPAPAALII